MEFLKRLIGASAPEKPKLRTEEEARQDRISENNADYEMGKYDSPLPEDDIHKPMRDLAEGTRTGPSEDDPDKRE